MPAQLDRNYIPPPNSLTVWADLHYIYVRLPAKPGAELPDPIVTIPRNGRGIEKLISLLYGNAETHGNIQSTVPMKKFIGTPAQHDLAQAMLRQRGIVK